MIVQCEKCRAQFEDEYRSTICPHDAFPANDGNNTFTVHEEAHLSKPDTGVQYDEDYFLRGRKSGKSLYSDYRWIPTLTIPMSTAIVAHCGIEKGDRLLDYGCARGYTVKALRELGYNAWGMDISAWAIKNADEETKPFLNWISNSPPLLDCEFDWIIAKDVLEHILWVNDTINELLYAAKKGVFAVVPLSDTDLGSYVVAEYEKDVTHVHRLTLATWVRLFARPGWRVECSYRVPGVKDNYRHWRSGNGFITARRIEEL